MLGDRELIVVTGKGGVGKSAISAALAWGLASRGRRTLVLETDPRETLHRLLETPPSDGVVVKAGSRLWLQNARPQQEIEALVRRRIPIPLVGRTVAASPVFHHFVEGAPGLKELAVLGHALRLTRGEAGPDVETVVLDAPATGHGVSLLAAPLLVADVIGAGPVAELAGEIAQLVRDPARCGVVVVTLAEEMPVQEAIEMRGELERRVGRSPDGLVVNQLYPPYPAGVRGPAATRALWRDRRAVNDTELLRLRAAWDGPMLEVPLVAAESGPALVGVLADHLDPWLGRA
ncbi:MAG: ArsA family ATPase [Gemmatimonadota bacterium]|nr:ArsA family ATPase [Gemmatimonadota bacterium]MDH5196623.1 ArsA family ATPase [Gemmatimonadota bacterium]